MEELKDLIISKDKTQEMSASDLKELNNQYGWFADDPKDFEDLGQCPYDRIDVSVHDRSLRLFSTHTEWKYFLPVKNLQRYLNRLAGTLEIQRLQNIFRR